MTARRSLPTRASLACVPVVVVSLLTTVLLAPGAAATPAPPPLAAPAVAGVEAQPALLADLRADL